MPPVLNMSKFWIWQSSEYGRLSVCECYITFWTYQKMPWQSSEYISQVLNMRGFWNMTRVLNIQDLHRVLTKPQYDQIFLNTQWICLDISEFTIVDKVLNMSHTTHSARSLYKLMSTYWENPVKDLRQSDLKK